MFRLTRYTRTCHYFRFGPLIQLVLLPMHILVIFWPGLSNLDSTCYSPHSFRRGGATFAFEAHIPSELIKAQGDWRSDCYFFYLEMSDCQKRAAATHMATTISQIGLQFSRSFFSLADVSFLIILSLSTTYYHVWALAVLFIDLSPASRSASL